MPTYSYKCKSCGRTFDKFQTSRDIHTVVVVCPDTPAPPADLMESNISIRTCTAERVPTSYAGIRWGKSKDFD